MSKIIAMFGQVLALGPKKPNKIYSTILVITLTVSTFFSNYFRLPYYQNFTPIKLNNNILIEVMMYFFAVVLIVDGTFCKMDQWVILWSVVERHGQKYVFRFLLAQVVFVVLDWVSILVWIDMEGVDFFSQYFTDEVLLYYQFYITCVVIILAKIIKEEYQQLEHKIKYYNLGKIQNRLVSLNDCVLNFNQIFGFSFVPLVMTCGLIVVELLDDVFKNSYGYTKGQYFGILIANLITIMQCLVPTFLAIAYCNQVGENARKLLLKACYLRRFLRDEKQRELDFFIKTSRNHFPQFTAAEFFQIDKSLVFKILGSVTTCLIVVVQFNAK
ncbi:gustatory receptor 50 [Tribolium castaneum]|uniref:Gustatory receptor n=1 Tax=Tribolium castaneum TaxID=7070 RepID=D2A4L8_TRICA|nr:gustatory receptor 50 [Tribolium castaneum]